jgi:hypothetical protein
MPMPGFFDLAGKFVGINEVQLVFLDYSDNARSD